MANIIKNFTINAIARRETSHATALVKAGAAQSLAMFIMHRGGMYEHLFVLFTSFKDPSSYF